MTDKLICPVCGEKMIISADGNFLTCWKECLFEDWLPIDIWKQIIAWKQSATVLQKKLDKAMTEMRHLSQKINELQGWRVADLNPQIQIWCQSRISQIENTIKEIEDIKEEHK